MNFTKENSGYICHRCFYISFSKYDITRHCNKKKICEASYNCIYNDHQYKELSMNKRYIFTQKDFSMSKLSTRRFTILVTEYNDKLNIIPNISRLKHSNPVGLVPYKENTLPEIKEQIEEQHDNQPSWSKDHMLENIEDLQKVTGTCPKVVSHQLTRNRMDPSSISGLQPLSSASLSIEPLSDIGLLSEVYLKDRVNFDHMFNKKFHDDQVKRSEGIDSMLMSHQTSGDLRFSRTRDPCPKKIVPTMDPMKISSSGVFDSVGDSIYQALVKAASNTNNDMYDSDEEDEYDGPEPFMAQYTNPSTIFEKGLMDSSDSSSNSVSKTSEPSWQIEDLQKVAGSRQLAWLPEKEQQRVAGTCPKAISRHQLSPYPSSQMRKKLDTSTFVPKSSTSSKTTLTDDDYICYVDGERRFKCTRCMSIYKRKESLMKHLENKMRCDRMYKFLQSMLRNKDEESTNGVAGAGGGYNPVQNILNQNIQNIQNNNNNNTIQNVSNCNLVVRDFIQDKYLHDHIPAKFIEQDDFYLLKNFLNAVMINQKNRNIYFEGKYAFFYADGYLKRIPADKAGHIILGKMRDCIEYYILENPLRTKPSEEYIYVYKYYDVMASKWKYDTLYRPYVHQTRSYIPCETANIRTRDTHLSDVMRVVNSYKDITRDVFTELGCYQIEIDTNYNVNIPDYVSSKMRNKEFVDNKPFY
jgi:uncharacterized C2H2 Zn-finger protein